MEKLLLACHYAWLRAECRRRQLTGLVSLLSSSLLRYADLVPADKAFFEAGMDAKEAGATSQAFVMLNRFLVCGPLWRRGVGARGRVPDSAWPACRTWRMLWRTRT